MSKLKLTLGMAAIAFITLTAVSCKDAKKDNSNSGGQHSEMNAEDDHDHDAMESGEMGHDNSDGHHGGEDKAEGTKRDVQGSTQKNPATAPILESYLQIKNALVQDDKGKAAEAGKMMLAAFSSFDSASLSGAQRDEYKEIAESAKEQAEHIVKSPIDHQREHFETLSNDVMDLITLLGTDKTLYQDYCPMKKVSWLSETKDIKNPFYGSEMLTCGNVKKQIN